MPEIELAKVALIRRSQDEQILLLDELLGELLDQHEEVTGPQLVESWRLADKKSWWSKAYARSYVRRYLVGCVERGELVDTGLAVGPTGLLRKVFRRAP